MTMIAMTRTYLYQRLRSFFRAYPTLSSRGTHQWDGVQGGVYKAVARDAYTAAEVVHFDDWRLIWRSAFHAAYMNICVVCVSSQTSRDVGDGPPIHTLSFSQHVRIRARSICTLAGGL